MLFAYGVAAQTQEKLALVFFLAAARLFGPSEIWKLLCLQPTCTPQHPTPHPNTHLHYYTMSGDDDIPQLVNAEVPSNEESDEVSCYSRPPWSERASCRLRGRRTADHRYSPFSSTVPLVSSEYTHIHRLLRAARPDLFALSSLGTTYSW